MVFFNLKKIIQKQLRRIPEKGRIFTLAYRQIYLLLRQGQGSLRMLLNPGMPHPENVYWIDPKKIEFHTNYIGNDRSKPPKDRVFHPHRDRGKIYNGLWDITDFRFDDLDIVQAVGARIEYNIDWRNTEYYKRISSEVKRQGSTSWGIRSVSDLDERCIYIDRLIESVKSNGYQLNKHMKLLGKNNEFFYSFGDEISVNIGRNGHYLFQDGRHRLAIAKVLRIPVIPVKVLVRHAQWVEFRNFMSSLALSGESASFVKALWQNPVHLDLQDIPFEQGCEERFNAIEKQLVHEGGVLLDVGANLGFFCHRFEELGYDCIAVESQTEIGLAAERIRVAESKKFKIIPEELFLANKKEPLLGKKFKIVLGLNVFHHFLTVKETYTKFVNWLMGLNAEIMFFEPHCSNDSRMIQSYLNFEEQQFVDFILQNSMFKYNKIIHRCKDGRHIYKIWR